MKQKLKSIRDYLQRHFPKMKIIEKDDFDLSAYSFKLRDDKDLLLLKIGQDFLDDYDELQIENMLNGWNIADLLRQHKKGYILVTNTGPIEAT